MTPKTLRGIVRGTTIELEANPGLEDGREVEVEVRPVASPEEQRKAILATAGCLSHLPQEVFDDLDEIVKERKRGAGRTVPE